MFNNWECVAQACVPVMCGKKMQDAVIAAKSCSGGRFFSIDDVKGGHKAFAGR